MPMPADVQVPEATQDEIVRLFMKAMAEPGWRDEFILEPTAKAAAEGVALAQWQDEKIHECVKYAFFIMRDHVQCNPPQVIAATIREDNAQMICAASTVVRWRPRGGWVDGEW